MRNASTRALPALPCSRVGALLVLAVLLATPLHAQDSAFIDLRGLAAFRIGDDNTWRSKYIDEREGWNFIPVPCAWERAGFPLHDGIAWYRVRFRIPKALRGDSLLLVMSEVDDADETFFNSMPIGATGSFPPKPQSELHSLRVYPLPRALQEDYNVLAVRVFDMADSGGITGSIFRVIRADSLASILNQIVDEPFHHPPLSISNGILVSAFNPATSTLDWTRGHLFEELEPGLPSDIILRSLTLEIDDGHELRPLSALRPLGAAYERNTGIVHSSYADGLDVYWYHPLGTGAKILVVMARFAANSPLREAGMRMDIVKQFWTVEQHDERMAGERRRYFILAFHSCCEELSRRDLNAFLAQRGPRLMPAYAMEACLAQWDSLRGPGVFLPPSLNADEQNVYRQSIALLLAARVREPGGGDGEIVSSFSPASRAIASPRDHLLSCVALAKAGLVDAARDGVDFALRAETGRYTLFDVYGTECGVGYPYLVTPAWYCGNGKEKVWARHDDAVLSFDGFPLFIEVVEALRLATKRQTESSGRVFRDSTFLNPYWKSLSTRVADVIMYLRDSSALIANDGGPWGAGLARTPNVYTSLHGAAALRIAARYARIMRDGTRSALYEKAAAQTLVAIERMIARLASQSTAIGLSSVDLAVFHPLVIDGITLGLFAPGSLEARFALDVLEKSFQIDDVPDAYHAQPDGDWFARQARPQLSLRLARAYLAAGNLSHAEKLFHDITILASENNGMIPELIDTVTKNWYGGIPAIGAGAAEYILTAEALMQARMK
jgi:hypothetical protein